MHFLYNIFINLISFFIPIIALFNPKAKLFYKGRKETFNKLQDSISAKDKVIWMHCASLGEFEQGRPVLEKMKSHFPNHKILLSFFSPSGYEVRKNIPLADVIVYLPIDTVRNAKKFLNYAKPEMAIFVKYEFWPSILQELKKRSIKTILISGIFRENQTFFTKKMKWFKKPLEAFDHFFVQDKKAIELLGSIGYNNTTLSGDTRFDRVIDLLAERKILPLVEEFIADKHVLVAGSTWHRDEVLLIDYINNHATDTACFIIAPHNINKGDIANLAKQIKPKVVLYSKATEENLESSKVLIIDSIGILTSVYAYANVAYVGGGFGTGIHNILEPATYGVPIVIGPNYKKFNEAKDLISRGACVVVHTNKDLIKQLQLFNNNSSITQEMGHSNLVYVQENTGATKLIMSYIINNINKKFN